MDPTEDVEAPYALGIIRLLEGPALLVRLLADDPSAIQDGTAVHFTLTPHGCEAAEELSFAYALEGSSA